MPYLSERQYGLLSHRRLLVKLKNSASITRRLKLDRTLNVHRGCVNTICWNDRGSAILSGSDDQHLIVTDPYTTKVLTSIHSGHRENIFSARFLPETNDRRVVSCSGDGVIFHTDFDRPQISHSNDGCFTCHGAATTYEVRVIPRTPNLFFSCSDDCTVRLYDLRTKSNCLKAHCNDDILIKSKWGITTIDVNPMNPYEIVCGCSDSSVRLYDHRKLTTLSQSDTATFRRCEGSINGLISRFVLTDRKVKRPPRITSVVFNQHGTEILASYSSESLYLLDPKQTLSQEQSQERLTEHRNEKKLRVNLNESKTISNESPTTSQKKPSQFKRLRLRGDWSDTGPDSRPINEQETELSSASTTETTTVDSNNTNDTEQSPSTNTDSNLNERQQQPSTTGTTRNRNLQNFFMQRMSDILTQLVAGTETNNEEGESTTATTNNNSSPSATTETTEQTQSTPIITSPIVELPPSPPPQPPTEPTTAASQAENDTESENSQDRTGFFDVLFGGDRRRNTTEEGDENNDDEDDNEDSANDDDEDEDNEDSQSTPSTTENSASSRRNRHPLMTAKWDRIMKRREAERCHEENLLKNVPSLGIINSYDGHRNARTMIKEANFWSDSYVMSGSDCGHIFIWNKFTGNIVRIIQADEHVVNCVQPHPLDYPILASSGIDYNIKIFSPLAQTPIDDSDLICRTIKRNHAMMEETSSTITVPATFMFRMLTSFYRLRRSEGLFEQDDNDE